MSAIAKTYPLPPLVREKAERAAKNISERKRSDPLRQLNIRADFGQLPLWSDSRRAMPNEYARSAIFTVRNKRVPRRTLVNQSIFVVGDCAITYTGIELRAYDDELVWLEILNLAKVSRLGAWVEFTHYQVCKALGWPINGSYYRKIHECLLRLKATAVAVHNKRLGKGRAISFIDAYEWENATGQKLKKCRVCIPSDMHALFAGHQFTEVEWSAYRKLSPVARRLYDYAASHKKPHALRLETVRDMCASDSVNRIRKWMEQVIFALDELKDCGLICDGEVRIELVSIVR